MEGGQRIEIPLTSGLDIKSSDMLVPADAPKFQHNRQQYQGHYLPSSVRFEHDGWAAGSDVYHFDIDEKYLESGRFKITKQTINNQPMYKFIFSDADDNQLGYIFYTPTSKLLKSNIADIAFSKSTELTATINNKTFKIAIDKNTNEISLIDTSDSLLVSYVFNSDYTVSISIEDKSAAIDVDFAGMLLPTEKLVSDGYTVGTFVSYADKTSSWQQKEFTFKVSEKQGNYYLSIYHNNAKYDSDKLLAYQDGVLTGTVDINISFTDNPQIDTVDFYPFISDISIIGSKKAVQAQAPVAVPFNKWSSSIYDEVNTKKYNSDKLYRNSVEGHTDFNKQTIVQDVPIWFGVTAMPGISINEDAVPDLPVGSVIKSGTLALQPFASSARPAFEIRITEKIRHYSSPRYNSNVVVWENGQDVTENLINTYAKKTVKIYIESSWTTTEHHTGHNADGSTDHTDETVSHSDMTSVEFNLDNYFDMPTSEADIKGMLKITRHDDAAGIEISVYKIIIENSFNHVGSIDLSKSHLFKAGTITITSTADKATLSVSGVVAKGKIPESDYNKYAQLLDSSKGSTGTAYWGICVTARVMSRLFLRENVLLDNTLSAASFDLEEVTVSDSDSYISGTNYFIHKITQASCYDNLKIVVCLCAKSSSQKLAYAATTGSKDNSLSFIPEYMITGSLKKETDDNLGNMQLLSIARNYSATEVDSEYGLSIDILGIGVRTDALKMYNYISSIQPTISTKNLLDSNDFVSETLPVLIDKLHYNVQKPHGWVDISCNAKKDEDYLKDYSQKVELFVEDMLVCSALYDFQNSSLALTGSFAYDGQPITVSSASTEGIKQSRLNFVTKVPYTFDFQIPTIFDDTFTLVSFENNVAKLLTPDSDILEIDYDTKQCYLYIKTNDEYSDAKECIESWNKTAVHLTSRDMYSIKAQLFGVHKLDNVTLKDVSVSKISLDYKGEAIDFNPKDLTDTLEDSKMTFQRTPVDCEELKDISFAKVMTSNEMQFVKQQWNTENSTENFWWIDSNHVLELTKEKLILKQKTDTVSDWDGDNFEEVFNLPRIDFLNSSVIKYFCTSAFGGQTALFITVAIVDERIKLSVYDPLNNMQKKEVAVDLIKRNLGEILNVNNKALNTYSNLLISNVITQSKWTSTCINNYVLIGIHFDNNFNQWTLLLNRNDMSINFVLQGYGYVGASGSLTGGEIPTKYFSNLGGFTGTVNPLSVLSSDNTEISKLSDLFTFEDKIVGTDSQQWYICKELTSIVSHLTFNGNSFIIHELPLSNNYSVNYDSASYASSLFSDIKLKITSIKELLPESNNVWNTMLALWAYPMCYYLSPKISIANYLQQTLGQAAYVHYNTSSIIQQKDVTKETITNNYSKEEAIKASYKDRGKVNSTEDYAQYLEVSAENSDEISFDKQSIKQVQNTGDPYTTLFTMISSTLISALDWGQDMLQVNKNQNQVTVSDHGRKYCEHFIHNLNSMAIADMEIKSVTPSQTSEVTAVKSLDMFYSTSDKQKICAGAGYVNHNFVAQCITQSVTSVQSEYHQQKLFYMISSLTMLIIEQEAKILKSARKFLEEKIDANGGPSFTGMTTSYSGPIVMGYTYAWAAADLACHTVEIGLDLLPQMLQALGGDKLHSSITAVQSRHKYDIEGKHRYGSKSECFMWPCFGIPSAQEITSERVSVVSQNKSWAIDITNDSPRIYKDKSQPAFVTAKPSSSVMDRFNGQVPYYISMIKGIQSKASLPEKMAYIIGAESFLPTSVYKNENIGESEPVFPTPVFQDYVIDESWEIGQTASDSQTVWISCKDTKVIDGELSNCVISDDFCGLASSYTAIEVKRGIQKRYLRPYTITPQVLALNQTGLNCCFEGRAYHAFDGYGYRVISWLGSAGMNKEHRTWLYSFLINDRFKRSNKMPLNELLGNFKSDPTVAITGDANDKVFTLVTQPGEGKGLITHVAGEDKSEHRYSIPIFSESLNMLPASVKTIASVNLLVIDGITSLTTDNRDLQYDYKSPVCIDFTIGKTLYRYTQEYICEVQPADITSVRECVPCLGLTFIGSTPYEAYLYSQATRQYYIFTGGTSLQAIDTIERFRNVKLGRYDFINQEILLPCLATFLRLDRKVLDDTDETDNLIIPRLKNKEFIGEIQPPDKTLFNTRSWFKVLSLPCGIVHQGPNRCAITRFITQDYMFKQIISNYGLWKRVPREEYHPFRTYRAAYTQPDRYIGKQVKLTGWTHNPFLLVTAPIGTSENTDNMYEWEITFCWPVEMDKLYAKDSYAVVNIIAETMTPGDKVVPERPVHVFLTKELFTTTGNYGYYSFRYQSKCGAGNRERLHIWSDQYICISSLFVDIKEVTQKRTEQLTQQVDIQRLKEI